jgi:D-arabinose 1-dehydrogenase-like Zn-dependent alcohol dehydrogenase
MRRQRKRSVGHRALQRQACRQRREIPRHGRGIGRSIGACATVDAKATDAVRQILTHTRGGAHRTLATAVSRAAFAQALQMVRRKDTVSLVGGPPAFHAESRDDGRPRRAQVT